MLKVLNTEHYFSLKRSYVLNVIFGYKKLNSHIARAQTSLF